MACDRSGMEKDTCTSDSSVGMMGLVIFNSFVNIMHAEEAFISVYPGNIVKFLPPVWIYCLCKV